MMIKRVTVTGYDPLEAGARSAIPAQILLTDDISDFSTLWPRTGALGNARCYAFQCADVLEIWCKTLGAARRTQVLFVGIVDDANVPLMLLALGIESRHGLDVLTFLDGGVCDYASPILFPPTRSWGKNTVRILWNQLRQVLPPYDLAVLERMPDHVEDLPNPLMFLATSRHPVSCHAITLNGTWEDFAATRLPRRQDSNRRRRQLGKLGELTFVIAETAEQRGTILDAVIKQKTKWYNDNLGYNLLERPGFTAYFREITYALGPGGSVQLSALKLNDMIISAHLGFVVGYRFYQYMPCYADDFRRFAPGRLLHEHLIQWSFFKGLHFFDFGIGDEDYKSEYCDLTAPLYRIVIPATARGRIQILFGKLREQLRKVKRRVWHK